MSSLFEKEGRQLLELAGLHLGRVMYDFLSVTLMQPVIDVVRLDRELHIRFGEYEKRGLSMDDILKTEFTPAAYDLINKMLLPEIEEDEL